MIILKTLSKKSNDVLTDYCIDRVVRASGMTNKENWELIVSGGYYGQEVNGAEFSPLLESKLIDVLKELDSVIDLERIKIILKYEYGYLLPKLDKINLFELKTIPLNSIKILNNTYYKKVAVEPEDYYKEYNLPRAVCVKAGNYYNIIDGYHRLISAINQKLEEVSIILLK